MLDYIYIIPVCFKISLKQQQNYIAVCYKQILVSTPSRWPDNETATCGSCVENSMHTL